MISFEDARLEKMVTDKSQLCNIRAIVKSAGEILPCQEERMKNYPQFPMSPVIDDSFDRTDSKDTLLSQP